MDWWPSLGKGCNLRPVGGDILDPNKLRRILLSASLTGESDSLEKWVYQHGL